MVSTIIQNDHSKSVSHLPAVFPRPLVFLGIKEAGLPKNAKFLKLFKDEIQPFLDENGTKEITKGMLKESRRLDFHVIKTRVPSLYLCSSLLRGGHFERMYSPKEDNITDISRQFDRKNHNYYFQMLMAPCHTILKYSGHIFVIKLNDSDDSLHGLFPVSHTLAVSYLGKTFQVQLLTEPDSQHSNTPGAYAFGEHVIFPDSEKLDNEYLLRTVGAVLEYSKSSDRNTILHACEISGHSPNALSKIIIHERHHEINYGGSGAYFELDKGEKLKPRETTLNKYRQYHKSIYTTPPIGMYSDQVFEEATSYLSEIADAPGMTEWIRAMGKIFAAPLEKYPNHHAAGRLISRMIHAHLLKMGCNEVGPKEAEDIGGMVSDIVRAAETSELAVRWAAHHAMRDLYYTNYRIIGSDTF